MKDRVVYNSTMRITGYFKKGVHNGIDIGWNTRKYTEAQNFDVYANCYGTVVYTQTGYTNQKGATGIASFGNLVKIKHANGRYSLYAHLKQVLVKKGVVVDEKTKIGIMGDTGNAYGTHLHFEVREENETRINPYPYLTKSIYEYKEDSSLSVYYIVQKGDNLSSIASKYGTTWQNIYELNKATIGDNPNLIYAGQKLLIKKGESPHKKTIDELAKEVIQGKWGNGEDRYRRLTQAGYNYDEVQKRVNEILLGR